MRTQRNLLLPATALAIALLGSACSASDQTGDPSPAAPASPAESTSEANSYLGNGVSFDYPSEWTELSLTDASASSGEANWQVGVGPGPGDNVAIMSEFTLTQSVTADNIAQAEPATTETVSGLFTQAGGAMTSGPEQGSMGGLPTLVYTGTLTLESAEAQSTIVMAFDGTTQYFLNCQATADMLDAMLLGCEQMSNTFQQTA